MAYLVAASLTEALAALDRGHGAIIAGGTDWGLPGNMRMNV